RPDRDESACEHEERSAPTFARRRRRGTDHPLGREVASVQTRRSRSRRILVSIAGRTGSVCRWMDSRGRRREWHDLVRVWPELLEAAVLAAHHPPIPWMCWQV